MATQTPVRLIEGVILTTSASSVYTSPGNTKTLIKNISIANYGAVAAKATVYLVPIAGTAGNANTLVSQIIAPGKTFTVPPSVNHIMEAGDTIQAMSDTATTLNIMASGLQIQI